jgi:hypothetical protein
VRRTLVFMMAALALVAPACANGDPSGGSVNATDRVEAYASAVDVLAKEAGRLVVEEIRPRLTDLREGRVTPEQFRIEAAFWRTRFDATRGALDELRATPALEEANRLFAIAFRQYAAAVTAFSNASRQPDLAAAIADAVPLAERADRTYDRADAIVQAELRRLGLPTRPTIP